MRPALKQVSIATNIIGACRVELPSDLNRVPRCQVEKEVYRAEMMILQIWIESK